MDYEQYIQEWNGKQVTKFGGECPAGIAEFEAENNRPIVWGDAVAWINNPVMLTDYHWIPNNPNDPNQLPARGDIVVWDGNAPYTYGSGHIAFFEHNIDTQYFMSFGQNSGGSTMHFAQVHWAHVAGWYHFREPVQQPQPQPILFYESCPQKDMVTNKQTPWYNLNPQTPVELTSLAAGHPFTVGGYAHHSNLATYAMTPDDYNRVQNGDKSTNNGVDTRDLSLSPPPPPTPPPAPPAAPIDFKKAEEYTILPPAIVYFGSAQDAVIDRSALGQLNQGTYKVVSRDRDMINVSTNYPNNENKWINPSMNVLPTPEPVIEVVPPAQDVQPAPPAVWKPQYSYLRADKQPIVFKSVNAQEYPILDYYTGQPTIYMPAHHTVKAVDKFTDSKGSVYYRSESMAAENLGYGIPKALLQEAVFDTTLSRAERLAMKSASFVDKAYYAWLKAEKNLKFLDGIKSVFAGINQGKRK